jgi:hypothetical protein
VQHDQVHVRDTKVVQHRVNLRERQVIAGLGISYVPDGWRCVEARRRHSGDEDIGARILRDRAADVWQIVVIERRVDVREPCCKIAQDLCSPVEALEAACGIEAQNRGADLNNSLTQYQGAESRRGIEAQNPAHLCLRP